MDFPNYFADAEASFSSAEYIIYGIPYEQTSSFRHGADKAPRHIRQASWNFETYNIRSKTDLQDIKIHDYGDLSVQHLSSNDMKSTVTTFASNLQKEKKFGIALGGDHSDRKFRSYREREGECGSFARFTIHPDTPTMGFDG